MKFKLILLFVSFALLSFTTKTSSVKEMSPAEFSTMSSIDKMLFIEEVYNNLETNKNVLPNLKSFEKGLLGFYALKEQGKIKKNILTIVDYSLPSYKKRLWVIDLNENKILYNTLVAHGVNSGKVYASKFSNRADSNKSSLGFFATGETYIGSHGLSLKLDGLEKGINHKARMRDIVVHGAPYVSKSYIQSSKHKILGRSQGCPALPQKLSKNIIKIIKNKSCLFIYAPDDNYTKKSKLIV